jgi:hypothetical protein
LNRRHFLTALGLGTAGFALDPEALLWRKGARSFFLPSVVKRTPAGLTLVEAQALYNYYQSKIADLVNLKVGPPWTTPWTTPCGEMTFFAKPDDPKGRPYGLYKSREFPAILHDGQIAYSGLISHKGYRYHG